MKKFIAKISIFLAPLVSLHLFTWMFYTTNKGDLLRVGYIMDVNASYRKIFRKEFQRQQYFTKISAVNLNTQHRYKILTIGDSFSEQDVYGYKNYLSSENTTTVLHFDRQLHNNPIQTLHNLLGGDFFDTIKVEFVILESVERDCVNNIKYIDTSKAIMCRDIKKSIARLKTSIKKEDYPYKMFSDRVMKFFFYNLFYKVSDNAYMSEVYQVTTQENLFSGVSNELIFFKGDLRSLSTNNEMASIFKLNTELNNLSNNLKNKGIKLIVLPGPDKYDTYYEYIKDKKAYPKPLFFEKMELVPKQYLYVKSKKILNEAARIKKDIYFYDDTHWSPWASQLIAKELKNIIKIENF